MVQKSSDLGRFWQELRRRKVFKVVAMYAGTAFIILEVVNNLVNPLRLPEWTPTLVIVLLGTGFPFAVIFSWIFDITPQGLKKTESIETIRKKKVQTVPVKRGLKTSDIIIAAMALVIIILLYPKIFKQNTLEKLRLSGERIVVAVMPFQNMTNDTTKNFWQEMIQENLTSYLSNFSDELKVRQTESITRVLQNKDLSNFASITPSVAGNISNVLDADVFIHGNINQTATAVRLNAKLIDPESDEVFRSFQIDGTPENILHITDSLSVMVKNFLLINVLQKEVTSDIWQYVSTKSPEAYKCQVNGHKAFLNRDFTTARNWFLQAVAIDSNLFLSKIEIALSYGNQRNYDEAKKWILRIYEKRNQLPDIYKIMTEGVYAMYFETPYEEINYTRQLIKIDDKSAFLYYHLGLKYNRLQQYEKSIPEFEKSLELFKKWEIKPMWAASYTLLGIAYHRTGKYKKEAKLYKKAELDFPDSPGLIYRQAILALSMGKTKSADEYIEKYKSVTKETSWSDSDITAGIAGIYSESGIHSKAEEYYRKALSIEPESNERLHSLAWFLISRDLNTGEGLELVDRALWLSPDNFYYLDTKGWGLFKQGRYQEALDNLQKSWELRRQKAVYDHEAFLHLEAAKKAVADNERN